MTDSEYLEKSSKLYGNIPVYESKFANSSQEFVYPETYADDIDTANKAYEGVVSCITSSELYLSGITDSANDLYLNYGNECSVSVDDIVNKVTNIETSIEDIYEDLLADYTTFYLATDKCIVGALNSMADYISKNVENLDNVLLKDGNFVINSQDALIEIMGVSLGIGDGVNIIGKSAASAYFSTYIKGELIEMGKAYGIMALDSLEDFSSGVKANYLENMSSLARKLIEGADEEVVYDGKISLCPLIGPILMQALITAKDFAVKTLIKKDQWTSLDTEEHIVNSAINIMQSIGLTLAEGSFGATLVISALGTLGTILCDKLIEDKYYTDSIPYDFEKYDIEEKLNKHFDFETVKLNGEDVVPEVAVNVLELEGLTKEQAMVVVAHYGSSKELEQSVIFNEDNGVSEPKDDYKIEVVAYDIYLESPNLLESEYRENYYDTLVNSGGYSEAEANEVIEMIQTYKDFFSENGDDIVLSSVGTGVSLEDLYKESQTREKEAQAREVVAPLVSLEDLYKESQTEEKEAQTREAVAPLDQLSLQFQNPIMFSQNINSPLSQNSNLLPSQRNE